MAFTKLTELAKRAGRWLGLGEPATAAAATAAVVSDRFDAMTWDETLQAAAAVRDLADDLAETHDYTTDLLRDVFMAAYKADPQLRETSHMHPGRLVNHQVAGTLLGSPEFAELRRETAGDQYAAAMALLAQGSTLRTLLDQTREAQRAAQAADDAAREAQQAGEAVQEALETAADQVDPDDGTVPDQLAGDVDEAIAAADTAAEQAAAARAAAEQAAAAAGVPLRAALRRAAAEAADQARQDKATMAAWGIEPGRLQRMSFEQRAKLAQRLRGNRLGKYADLIGRFRTMAAGERARRIEHVPGELVGITLGDDTGQMIPAEAANLAVPALRAIFAVRLAEKRLMQYDTRGEERAGQGAIIACVDCSSSMKQRHGAATAEAWAKACALALLDQAHAAGRHFVGILFSSPGQYGVFHFRGDEPIAIENVLEFAESFYGGGTDFAGPLGVAATSLDTEHALSGRQDGDIVLITDGACAVTEDWMRQWQATKHRLGFRTFGIAVGPRADHHARAGGVLDALSDNLRTVSDLVDVDAAADLFHTI